VSIRSSDPDPRDTSDRTDDLEAAQRATAAPPPSPVDEWHGLPIDPDLDVVPDLRSTWAATSRRLSGRASPRILGVIALGAMGGASARYGLAAWHPVAADRFPWATFWTNVSGSFVLGFLVVVLVRRLPAARYALPFAGTGFLGAYTTFSTFSVETDVLVKDGHTATAAAYVVASLVVGVTAAGLGFALGRVACDRRLARAGHV
jgi:CrcB protein